MMHIAHRGTDKYTVNNTELSVVQTNTGLGVIISQELKTTAHGCALTTKDLKTIWSVRRAPSYVDDKTLLTFSTVFVLPIREYRIRAASQCQKMQ